MKVLPVELYQFNCGIVGANFPWFLPYFVFIILQQTLGSLCRIRITLMWAFLLINFLECLFVFHPLERQWERGWREREKERIHHVALYRCPGWGQAEAELQNSIQGPCTWTFTCHLQASISWKLDGKQSCWVSNQHSNIRWECVKWQLNPLSFSAYPCILIFNQFGQLDSLNLAEHFFQLMLLISNPLELFVLSLWSNNRMQVRISGAILTS